MQCQHQAIDDATGATRICPASASSIQVVRYGEGTDAMFSSYAWCSSHAAAHNPMPGGTTLTPDADGMVTLA